MVDKNVLQRKCVPALDIRVIKEIIMSLMSTLFQVIYPLNLSKLFEVFILTDTEMFVLLKSFF